MSDKLGVYKAISAIQLAMSEQGISKDRKNDQQGYQFRGIDDVYNALSPLLAKHGLCILPRITERTFIERQTRSGGALFYVAVRAEFDFVAVSDGSTHTISTFGEAMDSGDKATNKAMSAAYKYACFMAFAIPTEGDNDADATTHDAIVPKVPVKLTVDELVEKMATAKNDFELKARKKKYADDYNALDAESQLKVRLAADKRKVEFEEVKQ